MNRLNIPTQTLQQPLCIDAINGGPIGGGTITLCRQPILLSVGMLHQEQISFLVTAPHHPGLSVNATPQYPDLSISLSHPNTLI